MSKLHQFLGTGLIAGALIVSNPVSARAQQHGGGHASHSSGHASPHVAHAGGHAAHVNSHPAPVHVAARGGTVHAGNAWHGGTAWHNNGAWHGNYYHNGSHYGHYPYYGFGLNYFPLANSYYPGYSYYPPVNYEPIYSESYYSSPSPYYLNDYANYGLNGVGEASPTVTVSMAARLEVVVPNANAQVLIDGKMTTTQGTIRMFDSPPLEAGKSYAYHVSASWLQDGKPVQAEKTVQVEAGKQFVVDFTQQ